MSVQQVAVIQRTDAIQPFHVKFVAGNGRRTFWCENLKTRAAALKALVSLGESFSPIGRAEVCAAALLPSGLALRVYSRDDETAFTDLEIREDDSRAKKE